MSLYDDLGVTSDATIDQINAAFRRAAKNAHPDAGGNPEKFEVLNRAVSILRDPEARARYDRDGTTADPQRSDETRAQETLCRLFQQAISICAGNNLLELVDVVAEVRNLADAEIREQLSQREMGLKAQHINAKAITRLQHVGTGPNIIGIMLEREADAIARQLEAMDQWIKVLKAARNMAGDWSWKVDAPVSMFTQVHPYANSWWTGTTFR